MQPTRKLVDPDTKDSKKDPKVKQTSLRLAKYLHEELRQRVEDTKEPAEQIIHRALWKELHEPVPNTAFRAAAFYGAIRTVLDEFPEFAPDFGRQPLPFRGSRWDDLEAYRFLQSLPSTCQAVIKEVRGNKATILWASESMERACHMDLDQMIGKTIDQLGVLTKEDGTEVLTDIETVIKKRAAESLEVVQWPGRGSVALRVCRFMFSAPDAPDRKFLGDLSFDFAAMESEAEKEAPVRIVSRLPSSTDIPAGLFSAFLEGTGKAGIGAAVKDNERRYLWVNEKFAARAGTTPEKMLGQTIEGSLDRPLGYQASITESDTEVVRARMWMFRKHWPKGMDTPPLVSLRFPIYAPDKHVDRIGVLNGSFSVSMRRIGIDSGRRSAPKRH